VSGAKWVCFCGSEKIEVLHNQRSIFEGRRVIFAKCKDCGRVLRINKRGMATLNTREFPFKVKG